MSFPLYDCTFVNIAYALELKGCFSCKQESEAARLNEEWCTLALKRLKEASPLALKVSLRSVCKEVKNFLFVFMLLLRLYLPIL
jgi:hypothetical protein